MSEADDLVSRSKEELETLRLAAEIVKLRAEAKSAEAPRGFIERYALPTAAIVGGLSGLAALLGAWVQVQEIDTVNSKKFMDQLELQRKYGKELNAQIETNTKLQDALRTRIKLTSTYVGLKSTLVANNTTKGLTTPNAKGQIDIFLYKSGSLSRGEACKQLLSQRGYFVRSVSDIVQGPRYDKIIYFWSADLPIVRDLQELLRQCGLSVPDGNLILVDPNLDYEPGKVAPRGAFEVWTSVGPKGTG